MARHQLSILAALLLALVGQVLSQANDILRVGVVYSAASGELGDWATSAEGACAMHALARTVAPCGRHAMPCAHAGYAFWKYRLGQVSPNGLPVKDSTGTTYYFAVDLLVQDDASDATTHRCAHTQQHTSSKHSMGAPSL
jgi:hypothetical protein